jgi:hypothetical protein
MFIIDLFDYILIYKNFIKFKQLADETTVRERRNKHSLIRETLAKYTETLPINTVYYLKTKASILSEINLKVDELTMTAIDITINAVYDIATALMKNTDKFYFKEINQIITNIVSVTGCVQMAANQFLNNRTSFMTVDFDRAVERAPFYDTDLLNYDTNPSKNFIYCLS